MEIPNSLVIQTVLSASKFVLYLNAIILLNKIFASNLLETGTELAVHCTVV